MTIRSRFLLCLFAALIAPSGTKPGTGDLRTGQEGALPSAGEEEVIGNANEMFAQAEAAANNGERSRAIKIYKKLVKKYPRANVSPGGHLARRGPDRTGRRFARKPLPSIAD